MSREEAKHYLDCKTCMDKNMDYQHIIIHLFHGEAESMTYSSPSLYQHSKAKPCISHYPHIVTALQTHAKKLAFLSY